MSTFFDQLETQLRGAARAQVARGRGRGRWRRGHQVAGLVPLLAAAAVTVAVAVAAALVIGHGHAGGGVGSRGPSGPALRQELRYIGLAGKRARRSGVCRPRRMADDLPAITQGSPSSALLSTLGVLRRPRTRQDDLPGRAFGNITAIARSISIRYVRRAEVVRGVSYYVLPVTAVLGSRPDPLAARCVRAIRAALREELARAPRRVRASTMAVLNTLIARQRRFTLPGVCLAWTAGQGEGASCGDTVDELRRWGLIARATPAGIVPDGVASVTLDYPADNGQPARTLTAKVVENVFVADGRVDRIGQVRPAMVWRSAAGRVIRTVPAIPRGFAGPPSEGACSGGRNSNICP